MPIGKTFWSPCFGMVTDRFGLGWMVTIPMEIPLDPMSRIRVLVGTRKGAFILTADGQRRQWEVNGPLFAGWEMYHLKGSAVAPERIYASQTSGWFGQVIQRSDDGGKTWATPDGSPIPRPGESPQGESNKFTYAGEVGTHNWYDGTQHPWEFKRVWHLEPSLTDPDTVFAGVEDAALFKSTNGGATWQELSGLRNAEGSVAARRGGLVRAHHPARPERSEARFRRHLRRRRFPHGRRRADLETRR